MYLSSIILGVVAFGLWLGFLLLRSTHASPVTTVHLPPKLRKKSCAPSGTRSMEPPDKHDRSKDEPTLPHSLPDLSTLPELVLVHILSFMDPKEAVQTCILSKQWRNLWTSIPSLNFNKHHFKGTDADFVHFVTSMLDLRGASKLDTFKLRWHASQHETDSEKLCQIHVEAASAWISSVLCCKPRTISLRLRKFDNSPLALFTCASLQRLELFSNLSNRESIVPKYVNIPNLKKLKFRRFKLNDLAMQEILSGCPLLEEFSLCGCSLNISKMKSDLIRSLSIMRCKVFRKVEVFMPSLISLDLKNKSSALPKLSLKNTPSLVKVFIFFNYFGGYCFSRAEFEFFECLTTVTNLKMHGSGVQALLEKLILTCPIFHNLKQLTFGEWAMNAKLNLLCRLLQHTPNLEKLTIVSKKMTLRSLINDKLSVSLKHANSGNAEQKVATGQIPFRCEQLKAIEIEYSDPTSKQSMSWLTFCSQIQV